MTTGVEGAVRRSLVHLLFDDLSKAHLRLSVSTLFLFIHGFGLIGRVSDIVVISVYKSELRKLHIFDGFVERT